MSKARLRIPGVATALLLVQAASARAEDVLALSLEQLAQLPVAAAAGYAQPKAEAPATTVVIHAAQWEAWGARSVYDVLQHAPGLQVVEIGREAKRQVIARGLLTTNNAQVLWQLDGLPLNNLAENGMIGSFDKGLAGLERIEIVQGPVSVIHGSNAFSAVINLVSREAGTQGHRVGLAGGSFDSRQALAETGDRQGDWRWQVSGERRQSDGDPGRVINHDLQNTFDTLFGTQAALTPAPLPADDEAQEALLNLAWRHTSLQAWHWENDAGGRVFRFLAPDSRVRGRIDHVALHQEGELPALATHWQLEALWQRQESNFTGTTPPGVVVPVGSDGNFDFLAGNPVLFPQGLISRIQRQTERRQLAINAVTRALPGHTLRLALGGAWHELHPIEDSRNFGPGVLDGSQPVVDATFTRNLAGTPFSFYGPAERQLWYAALEDDWRLNDALRLNLGLRHDSFSDFGTSTNPRVSLQWQARPTTTLRLGAGTAFRAPSFFEQGLRNNPELTGNPALQPEELHSMELGLVQRLAPTVQLDADVFHYKARDLIDSAPRPPAPGLFAQNVVRRDGQGGTLALRWQPRPGSQLTASVTGWDVRDSATGERAPFVPDFMAGASGWWGFAPGWALGGAVKHVSNRRREAGDPRPDIDDNTWANLHLHTTAFAPGLRLGLTVQNIGDADLRDPTPTGGLGPVVTDDLPLAGRAVLFEATYSWGGEPASSPERQPSLDTRESPPLPLPLEGQAVLLEGE